MTQEEWLKLGMDKGWCGPPVCSTHDGIPMTDYEYDAFDESDPCIFIIRPYDSPEQRASIEEAHSPSVWRKW